MFLIVVLMKWTRPCSLGSPFCLDLVGRKQGLLFCIFLLFMLVVSEYGCVPVTAWFLVRERDDCLFNTTGMNNPFILRCDEGALI